MQQPELDREQRNNPSKERLNPYEYDFFISYTGKDVEAMRSVAALLKSQGYRLVYQEQDMVAGTAFPKEMQEASRKSERVISILSQDYLKSPFCEAEWIDKWMDDPSGKQRLIVPIRIDPDCDLKGSLLRPRVYIDAVGKSEKERDVRILAGIVAAISGHWETGTFAAPLPGGSVETIWNTESGKQRNAETYQERSSLMRKLEELCFQPTTCVVHGIPGAGKSRLVTEYIYKHTRDVFDYPFVLWVRAESALTIKEDLIKFGKKLHLVVPQELNPQYLVDATLAFLNEHSRWVYVLDNAEDHLTVKQYLPREQNGTIIITSRNPNWDEENFKKVDIGVFELDEAISYLKKRTEINDDVGADDLAQELGRHPLALAQAAGYIVTRRVTNYATYLERFREKRSQLWDVEPAPIDHDKTVRVTYELAIEKIAEENRGYLDILRLSACFSPDNIPYHWFSSGAKHLSPMDYLLDIITDEIARDEALITLEKYGLFERHGEIISMHSLTQTVVSDFDEEREYWADVAIDIVRERLLPSSARRVAGEITSFEAHKSFGDFSDSIYSVVLHARNLSVYNWAIWDLAMGLGQYFENYMADYQKAEWTYRYCCRIAESVFGKNSEQLALALNHLAVVLESDEATLKESLNAHEQALAISRQIDPKGQSVVSGLLNCANVNLGLDRVSEANDLYLETLDMLKRGSVQDEVSSKKIKLAIQRGLCGIYLQKGNRRAAALEIDLAYKLNIELLHRDPEFALNSSLAVSTMLIHVGDIDKAKEVLLKSKEVCGQLFGFQGIRYTNYLLDIEKVLKLIDL